MGRLQICLHLSLVRIARHGATSKFLQGYVWKQVFAQWQTLGRALVLQQICFIQSTCRADVCGKAALGADV